MTAWIKGTIAAKTHWQDTLFSLQLKADTQPFEAGQHTWLALDVDGKRLSDPYSIASPPGGGTLEFFLHAREAADLATALAQLHEGDEVWVQRQAEGNFTLERVADADTLWLFATGTGVAPFLSILRTTTPWQRFRNVVLVYGVRQLRDLAYQHEITQLCEQHGARFRFLPLLSREQASNTLPGRITAAISDNLLTRATGLPLSASTSQIMLCGNPAMVRDVVALLQARGFVDNQHRDGQLTYERYW